MKSLMIVMGALALTASPALAHNHGTKDAPKQEHMKDGKMKCCKEGEDGKMVCEMMDHSEMDHPNKGAAASDDQHKDHQPE